MRISRRNLTLAVPVALGLQPSQGAAYAKAAGGITWTSGLPTGITPSPPSERMVGVSYETWFQHANWSDRSVPRNWRPWGTPMLGTYSSDDSYVIRKHAEWIVAAGFDFILVDWSNEINVNLLSNSGSQYKLFVERSTLKIFEIYSKLRRAPKIAFLIGHDPQAVYDGRLTRKAEEIDRIFLQNNDFAPLLQNYFGKPLLVVYVGTPSPFVHGTPDWKNSRFTIRWMTGYVSQQAALMGKDGVSRFGYWSWEDRGPPSYSVVGRHPDEMTVVASWRDQLHSPGGKVVASPGRQGGKIFLMEWARARRIGPRIVLVDSFNEWRRGEDPTAEISKDIEPSEQFGDLYLRIAREQINLFKSGL